MKKRKTRHLQSVKTRLRSKSALKVSIGAGILSVLIFYLTTTVNFLNPKTAAAASSGDYQTAGTGTWATASTWQKYNGTSWVAAGAPPTNANGVITIRSGHTVTVAANVTVDQVVVALGGTVIVNSGITLSVNNDLGTANDFDVTGILKNAGTVSLGLLATLVFENGGKYQHNYTTSAGTIPTATWTTGSICEIIGYTSNTNPPSNLQTFSNFIWNCTSQSAAVNFKLSSWNISGDFSVASTGSSQLILNDNDFTLTIGGDYIQSGGTFILSNTNGRTGTFNIGGDYNQTGGTFSTVTGTGSVATLKISGNWSHTGGTLNVTGDATTNAQVIFRNTAAQQTFTASGNTVNSNVDFTVNSNVTLAMGTNVLKGRKFTLSSSASLLLGHANGITASGNSGNIQTSGTRSFSTTASYTYNGTSAQVTGSGLPATIQNLTLDNSNNLTLTSTVSVSNIVALTSGKIITGSNQLITLNTAPASIAGYSSSNYIIGNLKRSVTGTGSYDFPVGTSSKYEMANVALSSVTGIANILGYFTSTNPIVSNLGLRGIFIDKFTINKMLDYGYWTLTPNAMTGGSYKVTLKETGQSNGANYPNLYCVLKRTNSSARWQSIGTHDSNTQTESGGTVTAVRSGLTSFSDFGIGYGVGFMIFENDSLISGTAGAVNAIYLFRDVSENIDAWVQILSLNDGASLSEVDNNTDGYNEAWQPFVKPTPNDSSSIKWRITFKKAGTSNDTTLQNISIMAVDVDGNNSNIKEFVETNDFTSYRKASNCNLTITINNPNIKAVSQYLQFDDIDTTKTAAMFEIDKTNVNTITYTTGIISTSSSTDARQFCLFFKPFFNFTNSPLPVSLMNFSAKGKNSTVTLQWATASETNNDYFTLARSATGRDFAEIARIKGSGNSSMMHEYTWTDNNPLSGTSYYRLTQTDYNGKSETFAPLSVSIESSQNIASEFRIYPNPFADFFNVQFLSEEAGEIKLQFLNYSGTELFSRVELANKGNNRFRFTPNENIAPGLYILRITKDNNVIADLKVLCKK